MVVFNIDIVFAGKPLSTLGHTGKNGRYLQLFSEVDVCISYAKCSNIPGSFRKFLIKTNCY